MPLTPGRSIAVDKIAACLWHAVLHRRRTADRNGAIEDAVPPPDDRAGHRLGHHRARRAPISISAPASMPARSPAGSVTARGSSCWCRRASIRWRAAASCRCRTTGRRRRSPNCFRKPAAANRTKDAPEVTSRRTPGRRRRRQRRRAGGLRKPRRSRRPWQRRCRFPSRGRKVEAGFDKAAVQRHHAPIPLSSMKRRSIEFDSRIAGAAADASGAERGGARAVGERRQAGQAAAQTARAAKPPVASGGRRYARPRRNRRLRRRHAAPATNRCALQNQSPPPLAPIGRRERSHLSRGRKEIDARLDLHGMTQTRAHRALFGFLQRAHHDGLTFVLIITGKGKIGGRVRTRRAAPSGAAMARPAGIPLAGGRLRGSPYRPWRRGRAVCPGAAGARF